MGHGGMSYQLKTARLIMILINAIFFLIGATLLGEGIELLITRHFQNITEFIPVIENSTNEILYIIRIILGLILVSIGFFGCSGAITQMQCLLFGYSGIIGIVLFFQTIIIMSLIAVRSRLKEQLIFRIRLFIRDIYRGPLEKNLESTSILWDLIMHNFKCCGIENKNDFNITIKWNRTNPWWNNSMPIENRNFQYPLTCCPINGLFNTNSIVFNRIISCAINGTDVYEISCYKKLIDTFHSIGVIILFIVLIEMFALIFVLVIYNRNQIRRISNVMERSPLSYSPRTRMNNANIYFPI